MSNREAIAANADFRKRVVVVGGNFAGLSAAIRLSREYQVTVLDPSPWFEFLPNIHELVSGVKSPEGLRLPKARLLQHAGHRFIQQAATAIRAAERCVETESGEVFPFDACVVAVGGINNTFQVPGVAEFAMPFKTVDDCQRIGARLSDLLVGHAPVSVVIVGGGLEGIECLGEILRRYRHRVGLTLHVVEANQRLLADEPATLDSQIRATCKRLPVQFHTGRQVKQVTEHEVEICANEKIQSDITIWTGGAAPSTLLAAAGLSRAEGEWAAVTPALQSTFFDNMFVVGDTASLPQPIAKQAYHAMDMGACAAENVEAFLSGRPLTAFRPSAELTLVSFGDLDTHLIFGGNAVSGAALAVAKEGVYQISMARLDPPVNPISLFQLQRRAWTGGVNLLLPRFLSPEALRCLAHLDVGG